MKKRNTCHTPTSFAGRAVRSKRSRCFIERTRGLLEGGHGTAIVLNAGALPVGTMARQQGTPGTLAFERGERGTREQQRASMRRSASSRNMAFLPMTLKRCGRPKEVGARFVSAKPAVYLWTTVTPKVTFGRFSVRPATPFLAGMSARRTRSSSSKDTWSNTADNPPPPPPGAAPKQGET